MIVADGFTGNVALKTLEGTVKSLLDALRSELESSTRGRLGGALIRPAARGLRTRLDPETYGGGYLLGLNGLGRDRARLELSRRDRECDPSCGPWRRARRGRAPRRTSRRARERDVSSSADGSPRSIAGGRLRRPGGTPTNGMPVRRGRGHAGETWFPPRRVSIGALHDPDGREVRFQAWRLRVRRSSSRSRAR